MDAAATITSKGQVTVPKAVRDALRLSTGDQLIFRVEGSRAIVSKTPNFLDLAGTVATPAGRRNATWDDVIRSTRATRAAARR